jgi:osmotically-inducible protein OsmY
MRLKRRIATLILTLALVGLAAGGDKPPTNDNFIYDSVREKLAADIVVKGGAIDVDVKDGVVTLKGRVQEQKQKSKAESLAKKVKGVKSVVNNLQIVPQ